MEKVFEFQFSDCIYESAAACISLHRTKKGAEMALAFHKEQKRKEHEELYESENDENRDYGEFDDYCYWGIREIEILD
jgi:hypothetical protein